MCACHFLLFPWIVNYFWNVKKFQRGENEAWVFCLLMWTFQCYTIFCEWCNMTKHFTSKVKDVQLPHYRISKSHVAFQDVLAVTNACPSIFSKLFTVNKVTFIVKVISSSLTIMASILLYLFFTWDTLIFSHHLLCNNTKNKQAIFKRFNYLFHKTI